MKTLPDFLSPGLKIMAVGLNPSPNAVRAGYPFATPTNRFWPALNQSALVTGTYPPSVASMHRLLRDELIGFTDVVKRPSPGSADLRAADYKRWAPRLCEKITRLKPTVVWFQGKVAYMNFLRHGLHQRPGPVAWGAQRDDCLGSAVFVTPNPSAANAAFSLAEITAWFDELDRFAAAAGRGAFDR